ncbi:hypothetical protein OsI_06616 [Oryza sativa Indica Group]|uniref:Uncharacterized protein n=1 Tax=Oryza sativa subsp. indica TaxID=39946 RepID=B8AF93_ORYSI|nr:hypothetical protein OsI_06616 [Oryza sativa Indica Group]
MAQMGAAAFAGNPELWGEVLHRKCQGSHLLFFHGPGKNSSTAPPMQSAAATGDGLQRDNISLLDSFGAATAGSFMAVLLCAMIAMKKGKKRPRPSSAEYPSPKKTASMLESNGALIIFMSYYACMGTLSGIDVAV